MERNNSILQRRTSSQKNQSFRKTRTHSTEDCSVASDSDRSFVSKLLEYLFHPVTPRYTCRPIVKPWPAVWTFLGLGLIIFVFAYLLRSLYTGNIACEIEYPSVLYDPDAENYQALLDLDKVNYPWVTIGDLQCDNDGCFRVDEIVVGPDRCSGFRDRARGTVLHGNIHLFYKMEPFYQNHRQYVFSRDRDQLDGNYYTTDNSLSCDPIVTVQDYIDNVGDIPPAWPSLDGLSDDLSKVTMHPCGLQAISVFNDTYEVYTYDNVTESGGTRIDLDSVNIAARALNFRNPIPAEMPLDSSGKSLAYEWLKGVFPEAVESPHFINWMKLSSLPSVMKLWGSFTSEELQLPVVVYVTNRYDVRRWDGHKSIVIKTLPQIGYMDPTSFVSFLLVAIFIFIIVIIFATKLRVRPRLVGDIRLLYSREHLNR